MSDAQNGKFQARARAYGAKRFLPVGEPTEQMSAAIHDMTAAFADDGLYEQTEVVQYSDEDGGARCKMTMTKKCDAEKLVATRRFQGDPG